MAIPLSSYFSGTPAHKTERNKKYKLKTSWNKYFRKEKGTGSSWKGKTQGSKLVFWLVHVFIAQLPPNACMQSAAHPGLKFALRLSFCTLRFPTQPWEMQGTGRLWEQAEVTGHTLTLCPWPPRALGKGQPSLARAEGGTHHGPGPTFPVPPRARVLRDRHHSPSQRGRCSQPIPAAGTPGASQCHR